MKHHQIRSSSRTKMVNWMMEIFASYSSEPLSFFLAVEIMDNFLLRTKKVYSENGSIEYFKLKIIKHVYRTNDEII